MIEINLLPDELRVNIKKESVGLDRTRILYAIPLVFGILIIIHICLAGLFAVKKLQLSALNSKWQKFAQHRGEVEQYRKEHALSTEEDRLMQQLARQRITWSEKLNKLSLYLPAGVWFSEITVNPKDFILKVSVISLQKQGMSLISKFMASLKGDDGFFKDFNALELSSVQRRIIGSYDIIDFILTGSLKSR